MTQQEILKYNKRCTEFLGAKLGKGGTLKNPCYVNVPIAHGNIIQTWTFLLKEMKFHSDWNWIMKVVEKIEQTVYNIRKSNGMKDTFHVWFRKNHCEIWPVWINKKPLKVNDTSKKEAVVQAINQFLIWYTKKIHQPLTH